MLVIRRLRLQLRPKYMPVVMGPGSRSLCSLVRDDVDGFKFQTTSSSLRGAQATKQSSTREDWIASLTLAMTSKTRFRIPAARFARALPKHYPSKNRGRRECRVPGAPAASRAKIKKHDELVTTGSLETIQHSLREWFYGLFRALPGDRAWLSPSSCETCFAQLDASVEASGPHGFAVRVQQPSSRAPTASIASPTQRS